MTSHFASGSHHSTVLSNELDEAVNNDFVHCRHVSRKGGRLGSYLTIVDVTGDLRSNDGSIIPEHCTELLLIDIERQVANKDRSTLGTAHVSRRRYASHRTSTIVPAAAHIARRMDCRTFRGLRDGVKLVNRMLT